MGTSTQTIKAYYDTSPEMEWERLLKERLEFDINLHFLTRYIAPGDTLLDLGGGPGRYALAFAQQGVRVTLCDLSPGCIAFAREKAEEANLPLNAFAGDAWDIAPLTMRSSIMCCLWGRCITFWKRTNAKPPCVQRSPV